MLLEGKNPQALQNKEYKSKPLQLPADCPHSTFLLAPLLWPQPHLSTHVPWVTSQQLEGIWIWGRGGVLWVAREAAPFQGSFLGKRWLWLLQSEMMWQQKEYQYFSPLCSLKDRCFADLSNFSKDFIILFLFIKSTMLSFHLASMVSLFLCFCLSMCWRGHTCIYVCLYVWTTLAVTSPGLSLVFETESLTRTWAYPWSG